MNKNKVLHSRNVIFNESLRLSEKEQLHPFESSILQFTQPEIIDEAQAGENELQYEDNVVQPELRRSTRNKKAPNRLGEWVFT